MSGGARDGIASASDGIARDGKWSCLWAFFVVSHSLLGPLTVFSPNR